MPWQHCGARVLDDQRCPTCGVSKGAWTLKFDATRLFVLSGPWEGDPEAQAAALTAAAHVGAPFCEKCEAARRAAAGDGGGAPPAEAP